MRLQNVCFFASSLVTANLMNNHTVYFSFSKTSNSSCKVAVCLGHLSAPPNKMLFFYIKGRKSFRTFLKTDEANSKLSIGAFICQVEIPRRWQWERYLKFSCYMQPTICLCERKYSFRDKVKLHKEEGDEKNVLMAVSRGREHWQRSPRPHR